MFNEKMFINGEKNNMYSSFAPFRENMDLENINKMEERMQNDLVDELNERIQSRHFSDIPLTPNFDPLPISTKCSHFPLINNRTTCNQIIRPEIYHTVEFNFNPSTRNAPPSGYFNNIDDETLLRNQTYKLKHGDNKKIFIPSSKSDLYVDYNNSNKTGSSKTDPNHRHSLLFSNEKLQTTIPRSLENIGKDIFSNHTRTQLRVIS